MQVWPNKRIDLPYFPVFISTNPWFFSWYRFHYCSLCNSNYFIRPS